MIRISARPAGNLLPVGARYRYNAGAPYSGLGAVPTRTLAAELSSLGEAMPSVKHGVVNPYVAHVHPYPTRYHGAIYTRPVFGTPFVRTPHDVFKPSDFHEFYAAKKLGSLGGAFGETTGGAIPGTKILWMSVKNARVLYLQQGLNKVLIAKGYYPIKEDGIFGKASCGALAFCVYKHAADTKAQVAPEVLIEAAKVCDSVGKPASFPMPVENPNAVKATEPVPVVVTPPVLPAPAVPTPIPETTPMPLPGSDPSTYTPAWVKQGGDASITYTPNNSGVTNLPELTVDAEVPRKNKSSSTGIWLAAAVVGAGVAYYFLRK